MQVLYIDRVIILYIDIQSMYRCACENSLHSTAYALISSKNTTLQWIQWLTLCWESNSSSGSHKLFPHFMGLECTLLLKFTNIPTNALYYNVVFLQLKYWDSDMFSPFLVGQPQGVHISICIKKSTLLCSQELSTGLYAEPTESRWQPHNIFLWNTV